MFRLFALFVLSTAVFAQQSTTPLTSSDLLTGANNIYRKVVKGSLDDPTTYKNYIQEVLGEKPLSYWHDIPLFFDESKNQYNMIVEIPRGEAILTSLNLGVEMNPITVEMDLDNKTKMENVDYIHNIGKFPQTYNNGTVEDQLAKMLGNGKPLDVVEISEKTHKIGDVVQVKILGLLGVVENEKVDWKVIAYDINSSHAEQINTLADVDSLFPDLLQATRGYFRFYRFPGQINDMLFNGDYQDAETARKVITEKSAQWKTLIALETPPEGIITTSHQPEGFFKADDSEWQKILRAP